MQTSLNNSHDKSALDKSGLDKSALDKLALDKSALLSKPNFKVKRYAKNKEATSLLSSKNNIDNQEEQDLLLPVTQVRNLDLKLEIQNE